MSTTSTKSSCEIGMRKSKFFECFSINTKKGYVIKIVKGKNIKKTPTEQGKDAVNIPLPRNTCIRYPETKTRSKRDIPK